MKNLEFDSSFEYPQKSKTKEECLHKQCPECEGKGVKKNGQPCIHMISCHCRKCYSPLMGNLRPVEPWATKRVHGSLIKRFPNPESRTLPFEKAE